MSKTLTHERPDKSARCSSFSMLPFSFLLRVFLHIAWSSKEMWEIRGIKNSHNFSNYTPRLLWICVNNLGVCLGEESIPGYLIVFVHFLPFHQSWCGFHLLKQLFWLESEDFVFYSAPTQTCSCFPSGMRSVFARLPPYWAATALSLTVAGKSWHRAQMSALGDVVVVLQFFVSCFRTARMFLFAYIPVIMSPRELNVAFLYLFW